LRKSAIGMRFPDIYSFLWTKHTHSISSTYSITSPTQPLDSKLKLKSMMIRSSKYAEFSSLALSSSQLLFFQCSRHFSDRRMGSDVDGGVIREDLKGYTLRITGGNDKQGFAMKQGVLVNGRVRILLRASKCNRPSLGHPRFRRSDRQRLITSYIQLSTAGAKEPSSY